MEIQQRANIYFLFFLLFILNILSAVTWLKYNAVKAGQFCPVGGNIDCHNAMQKSPYILGSVRIEVHLCCLCQKEIRSVAQSVLGSRPRDVLQKGALAQAVLET